MSLYGLDLILDRNDNFRIIEINGATSGMEGFRRLYGDGRVEDLVFSILEKDKPITLNTGDYTHLQWQKEHPKETAMLRLVGKFPPTRAALLAFFKWANKFDRVLTSPKAEIGWMSENPKHKIRHGRNFPVYLGQDSLVINVKNELLPHPTVNSYVAEAITRNKLLQHELLFGTEVEANLVPTVAVGLGMAPILELEKMITEYESFVVKPMKGSRGKGVRVVKAKELWTYIHQRGPVDDGSKLEKKLANFGSDPRVYVEDLIDRGDFSFERGMAVVQPFIRFKRKPSGKRQYACIRAIVCNGEFIDAYKRTSKQMKVNISQGAAAERFSHPNIKETCEDIVRVLERESELCTPENWHAKLYRKYRLRVGRTPREEDILMSMVTTLTMLSNLEGSKLYQISMKTTI